jgi:hypothetical protein
MFKAPGRRKNRIAENNRGPSPITDENCVRGVHEFSQSAGHKDESIMTPPPGNRHAAVNEAAET